jgi:hypothetical protein
VVVQLVCMVKRHRDRHDFDGRQVFEQRAVGMQGVSVFGGASVRGM